MGHPENQRIIKTHGSKGKNSPKPLGGSKGSPKREVYSNTGLPQETRKVSNTQPNLAPKEAGKKKQQIKPKSSKRSEIINIRAEISEIETSKQTNKQKKQ